MKFFSKLFFRYFDPVNIFFDNKIIIFRGDLSDISAKTATLLKSCAQVTNTINAVLGHTSNHKGIQPEKLRMV